jgi:hypothetical protein
MKQNTPNILFTILLIVTSLLLVVSFFLIKTENNIAEQITALKEIYLCTEQASDLNEAYFHDYIINQNELKNIWWNTIINQSGLSILFTAIILFITISISWMTQNQIENRYKENIKESERQLKDSILDVSCILNRHRGSFGAVCISNETEESHLFACLNSFNNLKVLTRNDFEEIYINDLKSLASRIWLTIHNKIRDGKQSKEEIKAMTNIFFQRIQNKIDRNSIIEYIYICRDNMKAAYLNDDAQAEKVLLDEEIMNFIKKTYVIRKFNG